METSIETHADRRLSGGPSWSARAAPCRIGRAPPWALSSGGTDRDVRRVRSDLEATLRTALADRYGIERPLGAGGMAIVFLARDLRHDRPVALKVLRPELADALGAERFLREIQIATRLHHPHILPLYDGGLLGHPRRDIPVAMAHVIHRGRARTPPSA